MSERIKKNMVLLLMAILGFALSFFSFNGIYFVAVIPYILFCLTCEKTQLIASILGVLASSFIIDYTVFPFVVSLAVVVGYLLLLVFEKTKIDIKMYLSILGVILSEVIVLSSYFSNITDSLINIILIPVLEYVLCANLVNIQYDLNLRDSISLTKKQVAFVAFVVNLLLSIISLEIFGFKIGFTIATMLNYIFIRIDPLIGVIGCVTMAALNIYPLNNVAIFALFPLVFTLKTVYKNQFLRSLVYLLLGLGVSYYFKNYSLLDEVLVVGLYLLLIKDKYLNVIHKYVVEPQDYELKLYQKSYYDCLNKNKKIQKAISALEMQMHKNTRLNKANKDILFKSMQFLNDKLKEEDNIRVKEIITNELEYENLEILQFKLNVDYFYNYKICLQLKNQNINEERIIEILQNYLNTRLRIIKKSKNDLLPISKYIIVNDEKISFNFSIKQRSKDEVICGDTYIKFDTKNKKYFMISDGMGHGKNANEESAAALLLLKSFLELQMNVEDAILSCNALLFDKEKEKFNTLDLLEYDFLNQQLNLYKNGSGTTYLKKDNNVEKLSSENLPLGIVENIKTDKITIELNNDYIILTSDGFKKDLTDFLKQTKAKNAKQLTEDILLYEGDVIDDDQTIVVINVIKNY